MGLCGSFRCGCGVTSTAATTGAINGELPSIFVSGSGEAGDPYDLQLNDAWAAEVTGLLNGQAVWLTHSVAQSIGHNAFQVVTWDTEQFDTSGFHNGTNPTRITIPTGLGGLYAFGYQINYVSAAGGERTAHIRRSATAADRRAAAAGPASSVQNGHINGASLGRFVAGDYLEVFAYQNQTTVAGLLIQGDNSALYIASFWAVRLAV